MPKFHEYLKSCRTNRGLTIDQAANAMDISRSLIYQYEANKAFPSGKNLIKLARFYRFSLDAIFNIFPATPSSIPTFNLIGEAIYQEELRFHEGTAYYVLSSHHAVLVKTTRHFQTGQQILAFFEKKATVFIILNMQNKFYLLHPDGKLFPYNSLEVQIIGMILQWISF